MDVDSSPNFCHLIIGIVDLEIIAFEINPLRIFSDHIHFTVCFLDFAGKGRWEFSMDFHFRPVPWSYYS